MKLYKSVATFLVIFFIPLATNAALFGNIDTFFNNITKFISTILVPLVFALALIIFLWGVTMYFIQGGDENKRTQARSLMLYGIIGFVLMTAIWGIVNFIASGLLSGTGESEEESKKLQIVPTVPEATLP